MSLLTGVELDDTKKFFSQGSPTKRASSFDLTIGIIFNKLGKEITEPYALEPGHMVQVVSKEVFNLPATITGHVTYKTDLTKKGIWALTVGIVDPGWKGPVTTTLLNFSEVDYVIFPGSAFLRVSLFEHPAVPGNDLPGAFNMKTYLLDAQEKAMTRFPRTFLNQDEIQKKSGDYVLDRISKAAILWVALLGFFFTFSQWLMNGAPKGAVPYSELNQIVNKIEYLTYKVDKLEKVDVVTPQTPSIPATVKIDP